MINIKKTHKFIFSPSTFHKSRWVPPTAKRSRSWQELPAELTESVLGRLDAVDKLLRARKVCKTWRRICSDPSMYRVVDLCYTGDPIKVNYDVNYIARQAVTLSSGQLIEFSLSYFADDYLLDYISCRSSQLRCLHLASCINITIEGLIKMVKKLPLLDELHLYCIRISKEAIKVIGRCCPQLKTFRLNYKGHKDLYFGFDENAIAIAKNMPGLCHLQLFGNRITRAGLLAILKNCPHLESLDMRQCFEVNLEPDLIRRLSQQMKYLRLPYDSTEDSMGSRWVPPPAKRSRSWQELPAELTESILGRLDAVDKLLRAQKVCKTWRRICSDPSMYRVVDLCYTGDPITVNYDVNYIARQAVTLSRGQLIEFSLSYFADDYLLDYISCRSSQLRCLHLASCSNITIEGLIKMVKKLPLLDELHLYCIRISKEAIKVIGRCCPQLKTFRLNYQGHKELYFGFDENALAIAKNMPGLCHLQLFGNRITRAGLLAILENCPHLKSLDIRQCFEVNLEPDLIRRLSQQMKYLRLPYDSPLSYSINSIYTEDSGLNDDIYELDSDDDNDPSSQSDIDIVYYDDYEYDDDDYEYYNDDYDYNENSGGSDIDYD